MKSYTITYTNNGQSSTWTEESGMLLKDVISYFTSITGNEIDSITNIAIEDLTKVEPKEKLTNDEKYFNICEEERMDREEQAHCDKQGL